MLRGWHTTEEPAEIKALEAETRRLREVSEEPAGRDQLER